MKCWICGDEATSREHRIKASDLKALFGSITNKNPLYFHNEKVRNSSIAGIKSDKLKYKKSLCSQCNNRLTQPYDRAWESLSQHLRSRSQHRTDPLIRLEKIFPGCVRKSMLDVHLFFLKLFGCLIVENAIPMDIQPFAKSIHKGIPHPNVKIAFWTCRNPLVKQAGFTPVNTDKINGVVTFAMWIYIVDNVSVHVMYAEATEHRKGLAHSWHPSTIGKRVRIQYE